ncbi:unnamed protein product [Urochloa decumbens]|uniref:Dehydrin 1 n=1 Tax=Urochloa decumbens TaxID=240449 RepID=A0ABC9H9V3_9POAL
MEHQGQHVHATACAKGYGNPAAEHQRGHTGDVAQVQPAAEEHRSRGVLHRSGSSSSSSSSSEDDGMGGRRKKGLKDKIKEKLPGGHKDNQQNQATAAGGSYGQPGHTGTTTAHGTDGTAEGEKKGLMNKIKEKLPGHH